MKKENLLYIQLIDDSLKEYFPWEDQKVPIRIIKKFPHFYLAEVLPHKNKKGFSKSKPYNITFTKQDITEKRLIITKGA